MHQCYVSSEQDRKLSDTTAMLKVISKFSSFHGKKMIWKKVGMLYLAYEILIQNPSEYFELYESS